MDKKEEYFSYVRHELRNQLGVIREGVSQIVDGLGGNDCKKCRQMLKPVLDCADKFNEILEKLLSVSAFAAQVPQESGDSEVEIFKKELVALVSHEIRTPLAIINEGLALLGDEIAGKLNVSQAKLVLDVRQNTDRLTQALEKILNIPWESIINSVKNRV